MNNSTFDYFKHGSNGIVFVATLNPDTTTNYKYLDASAFGTPVTKLIIKVCFVMEDGIPYKGSELVYPVLYDEFKDEVNIQTDIFLKTMNYLQPLCPAIVYANVFDSTNNLLSDIVQSSIHSISLKPPTDKIRKQFTFLKKVDQDLKKGAIQRYGIIAMELADNYNNVYKETHENPLYTTDVNRDANKRQLENMVRYMLVELAVKTGYNQGDYHASNVLINLQSNTYFKGINGEPLLIDFGYTVKFSEDKISLIKDLYKNKDYQGILEQICLTPRSDGTNINTEEYADLYGYICDASNSSETNRTENNKQIADLIQRKTEATDDIIQLFNSKTDEREKYPMLPLSNKMKNQMYVGIMDIKPMNLIKLSNVDLNLNLFRNPASFPEIIGWMYDVCKIPGELDKFINCCYYYVYLIKTYNPEEPHWKLYALAVFYKFNVVEDVRILNYITNNSYTESMITQALTQILPKLDKTIITFYKLLTKEGEENFQNYVKDNKEHYVSLMSNLVTYTNITMTAAHFGIRQPTNNNSIDGYEFPFDDPTPIVDPIVEPPPTIEPPKRRSILADSIREDIKGGKYKRRQLTKRRNKRRLTKRRINKRKGKRRLTKRR
jgi:hypothetical protein